MATHTASGTNDDNVIFKAGQSEVERLDMQHEMISASLSKLIYAPIDLSKSGLRILDQATGSGIWLREVRSSASGQHEYVGTDIEDSYFPTDCPDDTKYFHQSMTQPWPADWAGSFDLVHSRMALPGAGTNSIQDVVKNLIALVKPGGYIQLVEMDFDNWEGGAALQSFRNGTRALFGTVTGGKGVTLRKDTNIWLREAELEEVNESELVISVGTKAKSEIQNISVESMVATANKLKQTSQVIPLEGFRDGELDDVPENLRKELQTAGGEFKLFAIWGRKPLSG